MSSLNLWKKVCRTTFVAMIHCRNGHGLACHLFSYKLSSPDVHITTCYISDLVLNRIQVKVTPCIVATSVYAIPQIIYNILACFIVIVYSVHWVTETLLCLQELPYLAIVWICTDSPPKVVICTTKHNLFIVDNRFVYSVRMVLLWNWLMK